MTDTVNEIVTDNVLTRAWQFYHALKDPRLLDLIATMKLNYIFISYLDIVH
jgi:hypothetical protein